MCKVVPIILLSCSAIDYTKGLFGDGRKKPCAKAHGSSQAKHPEVCEMEKKAYITPTITRRAIFINGSGYMALSAKNAQPLCLKAIE